MSPRSSLDMTNLPYTPLNTYNGTTPTGGSSLTTDLNTFYQTGDTAWILTSTALVLLQAPGVGLFYSGLVRRKNALSCVFIALITIAWISFQWFFWGYSLSFSHRAGKYVGALDNFGMKGVLGQPSVLSARAPDLVVAVYQGMFACLTNVILMGAIAERGRMLPALVFLFIWTTIVYNPLACWTWNPRGWAYRLGVYDFAGGTPVHIASGTAALAYSWMLGKRKGHGTAELNFRPHNTIHIAIGTVFIWFGWFGFNGGSALTATLRAVMAAVVTNLAASVAGLTWCLLDYRLEQKWSLVGFCSGVVAGLVCITPGSGFVPPWAAVIFGILAGVCCNFGTRLKFYLKLDDALDVFAIHAIGGFIGNILTAFFAADYIAALDGFTSIPGGWLNRHYGQLAWQLVASLVGSIYCFVITAAILKAMNYIPGLSLRATAEAEEAGMDEAEMGEFAYDYVEHERHVKPLPDTTRPRKASSSADSTLLRKMLHAGARPTSPQGEDLRHPRPESMDVRGVLGDRVVEPKNETGAEAVETGTPQMTQTQVFVKTPLGKSVSRE